MALKKRGQGTLEYVVILTAIVGAILAAAMFISGGENSDRGVSKLMKASSDKIMNSTGELKDILPE